MSQGAGTVLEQVDAKTSYSKTHCLNVLFHTLQNSCVTVGALLQLALPSCSPECMRYTFSPLVCITCACQHQRQ